MSGQSSVPSYLECAKPNPMENRAPWYKNTAPSYAGIFLWFVFWSGAATCGGDAAGGVFAKGWGTALLGVFLGAAICYVLFYLVFGRLGQKTGLPLYIVGSSTFGATGGFILPGFFMGLLQFGWVAVNIFGATAVLNMMFKLPAGTLLYPTCASPHFTRWAWWSRLSWRWALSFCRAPPRRTRSDCTTATRISS